MLVTPHTGSACETNVTISIRARGEESSDGNSYFSLLLVMSAEGIALPIDRSMRRNKETRKRHDVTSAALPANLNLATSSGETNHVHLDTGKSIVFLLLFFPFPRAYNFHRSPRIFSTIHSPLQIPLTSNCQLFEPVNVINHPRER